MLEGRIEFVPEAPRVDTADLHVWVEDTTYVDAAAVQLFHARIPLASLAGVAEGLAFRVDYEARPVVGRTHTLSVIVDLDGDGRAGRGDFISTEAVQVPEHDRIAVIRVRRIE